MKRTELCRSLRVASLLLTFGSIATFSQNELKAATNVETISPVKIASAINYSRTRWLRHSESIEVPLNLTWQKLAIDPGYFDECDTGHCQAWLFRDELDGRAGRETILKITKYESCRYVIFSRYHKHWRFVGYVDHDFNKYEESRHHIEHTLNGYFFVVRGQEGSGSGFALYAQTWYVVSPKGLIPVLYYPIEGHTYPWPNGLGREFKASVISTARKARVIIRYTVKYDTLDYIKSNFERLAVNHHRIGYVWNLRARKFTFAQARSNITENEVNAIANIQPEETPETGQKIGNTTFYSLSESKAFVGDGYEIFLKYNFGRVEKLAVSGTPTQKEWLRQFLKDCEPSSEKKKLEGLLKK